MFCLYAPDLGAVYQRPFHHQTSQAMGDPYYRTFGSLSNAPIRLQRGDQLLGMIVNLVLGCTVGKACDIGVVTVDQHAWLFFYEETR